MAGPWLFGSSATDVSYLVLFFFFSFICSTSALSKVTKRCVIIHVQRREDFIVILEADQTQLHMS